MRRRQVGVVLLTAVAAQAAAPPPLWRELTVQEKKEVEALEERLHRHAAAGEFEQAAQVAEKIAAYRSGRQGAEHWEAIEARFEVEEWQRLARVPAQARPSVLRARDLNLGRCGVGKKGPIRRGREVVARCPSHQGEDVGGAPLHRHQLQQCGLLSEQPGEACPRSVFVLQSPGRQP